MYELKNKNLYYVGGVVRDEVLKAKSFDTDFCYEGNAIKFAEDNFSDCILKKNPNFGTVRILIDGKEIDIASTREEYYPKCGHLPVVTSIGCPLEKDLKRRDFTINAIAKNTLSGQLFDPFGGKSDIEKKLIKVLHEKSFIDDPTRIIRALKFAVRFGFDLEPETKKLQENYLANINYDMSYHRLKKELVETFNLNNGSAFDMFIENKIYKLLSEDEPKVKISGEKIQKAVKKAKVTPWIIYMSFFNLENLELTRQEKRIIKWAERLKSEKITNNTPQESIIINNLYSEFGC